MVTSEIEPDFFDKKFSPYWQKLLKNQEYFIEKTNAAYAALLHHVLTLSTAFLAFIAVFSDKIPKENLKEILCFPLVSIIFALLAISKMCVNYHRAADKTGTQLTELNNLAIEGKWIKIKDIIEGKIGPKKRDKTFFVSWDLIAVFMGIFSIFLLFYGLYKTIILMVQ